MQEVLGIKKSETISFGDYLNDLEMFEQSAFNYAMVNAHPGVIAKADAVAPSNSELGVLQVINQLLSS